MVTVQKTTIRRYNKDGDWDPIYMATVADIVSLGANVTLVEDTVPYAYNQTIQSTDNIKDILSKVLKRLATYDEDILPGLADGSGITNLNFDSPTLTVSGTVKRANLPTDVSGKVVPVASEAAKAALTKDDVNVGDLVKVTNGVLYMVNAISSAGAITYEPLTDESSDIQWSRVKNVPTEASKTAAEGKLHLSNVVLDSELVNEGSTGGTVNASKPVKTDANGKLNFDILGDAATLGGNAPAYYAKESDMTIVKSQIGNIADPSAEPPVAGSGLLGDVETLKSEIRAIDVSWIDTSTGPLPLSLIPKGAQERMYVITSLDILADKTAVGYPTDAGDGDTIQVNAGDMYYVYDETKLGTAQYADGIRVYTSGKASSVDWANVQNKPTTLAGYGITDAVNKDELVTEASAANEGKILVLNAQGKLPVSITGDAVTLNGHADTYFATATDLTTVQTRLGMDDTSGVSKRVADLETSVGTDANSGLRKTVADHTTAIGTSAGASSTGLYKDIYDLQQGTTILHLNANVIDTGTVSRSVLPTDVGGVFHEVATFAAAKSTLTSANTFNGDIVRTADGLLYGVKDNTKLDQDAGYVLLLNIANLNVAWSALTGVPTSAARTPTDGAMTLTNVMLTTDPIADANSTESAKTAAVGQVVKVAADKKLHVDIAGDATTLNGHADTYFATASDLDETNEKVDKATIMLVNSTDEIVDAQEGQFCLVKIS